MKNPVIIANWKMNLNHEDSLSCAKKIAKNFSKHKGADVVLCPSFTDLISVRDAIAGTGIYLGAQNCFWDDEGSYTGEISPKFLEDIGVKYVIVGHSERRKYFGEDFEMIRKKITYLTTLDITPVLCVGETFDERQDGLKDVVLQKQLTTSLSGLWFNKSDTLIIAYEPVWMIGTGQDINPDEIEHSHRVIKQLLYDLFPDSIIDNQVKIIYGGSVDPENARIYLREKSVSGLLVGKASLDPVQFGAIVAGSLKK